MGLFEKKYCDICGEKIGLLGNRKLEDGNLCKDCAKKLSPFFSERRHSTVEEIKKQLAYREENEQQLADFRPDIILGESKKVYIDRNSSRFIVTSSSNWRNVNPDLIRYSQVTSVNTDIHENKTEIYYKDEEGNRKSYYPRRYECNYEFNVTILVDSPWFDKIELELSSGNRPDSPYTDLYRRYEEQIHTLSSILNGGHNDSCTQGSTASAAYAPKTREEEIIADVVKHSSWICKKCGTPNTCTETCQNCNAYVNDERLLANAKDIAYAAILQENTAAAPKTTMQNWRCQACGSQNTGKFCENCGAAKPLSETI